MLLAHLSEAQERVLSGVASLLIPAYPPLDPSARLRVAGYVSRFLSLQVENIPPYLRVPYLLAVTAFQWLPLLRYGRRFLDLPIEAQRAYLALWSDGPIPQTRDFVRLIRGCTVLAYFDHAEVRQALDHHRPQAGNGHLEDFPGVAAE